MATMKEIDAKLNEFWALFFKGAALCFFIWLGLYSVGWAWGGLKEVFDKNVPALVTNSSLTVPIVPQGGWPTSDALY